MCFTDTWFYDQIRDSIVTIPGFHTDRKSTSGKKKRGAITVCVKLRWCNPGHICVKERVCNPNIKLLAIGLRPDYLPREFTSVVRISVYTPPFGNMEAACDVISTVTAGLQTKKPGTFIIITGDFNHASLSCTLPIFYQFVKCTRDNNLGS